jgi:myo-inositol-1(or 4)-monophosphatase
MSTTGRRQDLERIRAAAEAAGRLLRRLAPGEVGVRYKEHGSPVTDADHAVDDLLRATLPREGEGWLSEETPDDPARLGCRRVWIVDPLDGTRELLAAIPEWCVAIGLAEDGEAVAGGVYNPVADELYLGAVGLGATLNGVPVRARASTMLPAADVLVSRWGVRRARAHASAGRADATWSRSAVAEWDIAAGVALVRAAGGHVTTWAGDRVSLNRWPPRAPGLVACGSGLARPLRRFLATLPG